MVRALEPYESIPCLAVLATSVARFLNTSSETLALISVSLHFQGKLPEKGSSGLDAAENYDVPSLFMELSCSEGVRFW